MDIELMINSFPKLLNATLITLKLLSVSLILGLFIGLGFAILRMNNNKLINKFAYGYSYIFRGTPLLVQIFIIYFGLGQIEYLRTTFLWVVLKEPYWCAIIAFSLNTGAYTSEILRSAFQTIKPGYLEAGRSLGIPSKIIFTKIQIPIAIKQSLPAYGNEIILMLKGTSLASTVTLMDLTGVAKYIISTTFKPVEVFIVAGGIYLFMTFIIHNVIKYLEKKYGFERIIFQLQDNNKLGIVLHSKNPELINSYIGAKDEEVFKQKIITNFNKLFEDNSLVNKLSFDDEISIMKWRASQPSGIAVPLSLQFSRKYRIGFCGDWFEGEGFGRIEGSILSALILEKKINDLIK